MSFVACFNCGKYWPVKSTGRHEVPGDHEKTYNYQFESDVPDELEKEKPNVKDFSASAYPVKSKIVYPLSALEGGLFDVEVGDVLTEEEEPARLPRVPEEIEVTGLVRHWDRIELFYEEAEAA